MGKFSLEETVKYNKSGPARYCCRTDVWKEAAMILPSFGKRAVVSGQVQGFHQGKAVSSLGYSGNPVCGEWILRRKQHE